MITTPVKIWRRGKKLASMIGAKGTVQFVTIIRVPPKSFSDQAPYPVALVKLENGDFVTGQIVDWNEKDLKKGRKVIAVMRKVIQDSDISSVIHYGIKYKPL